MAQETENRRAREEGQAASPENGSKQDRRPLPGLDVIQLAKDGITAMTGRFADSVSSVQREDDAWRLSIEVVELERVPSTTNLMATYEVMVNEKGDILAYEQVRRYMRGQADDS